MAEDKYNNEQNIHLYYALKPWNLGFITPLYCFLISSILAPTLQNTSNSLSVHSIPHRSNMACVKDKTTHMKPLKDVLFMTDTKI